jgi:uncharacterized protein YidB (DUF937 family)
MENHMGLFEEVTGKAFESLGLGSEGNSDLLRAGLEILNNKETGGLSGMVQAFQQKGLGDIILSWISTGDNLPVSVDQLLHGLGEGRIQEVAEKAGISTQEAASQLSALLSRIIDMLTPDGKIPDGNLLEKGLEMIKVKR